MHSTKHPHAPSHNTRNEHIARARSGMSLMEIMVAVGILAVVSVVATIPFSNAMNTSRLQRAADRLVADLRVARTSAIRDQQAYECQFYPAARRYVINGASLERGETNTVIRLARQPYCVEAMTLQWDEGGETKVKFSFDGRADPAGNVILSIGDEKTSIRITPDGGIERVD